MKDLQSQLSEWHHSTYGQTTHRLIANQAMKIHEEYLEFIGANADSVLDEAVDVIIAVVCMLDRMDVNVDEAIRKKLEVLKSRDQCERDRAKGYSWGSPKEDDARG